MSLEKTQNKTRQDTALPLYVNQHEFTAVERARIESKEAFCFFCLLVCKDHIAFKILLPVEKYFSGVCLCFQWAPVTSSPVPTNISTHSPRAELTTVGLFWQQRSAYIDIYIYTHTHFFFLTSFSSFNLKIYIRQKLRDLSGISFMLFPENIHYFSYLFLLPSIIWPSSKQQLQ